MWSMGIVSSEEGWAAGADQVGLVAGTKDSTVIRKSSS
jgi:hypothetical protein